MSPSYLAVGSTSTSLVVCLASFSDLLVITGTYSDVTTFRSVPLYGASFVMKPPFAVFSGYHDNVLCFDFFQLNAYCAHSWVGKEQRIQLQCCAELISDSLGHKDALCV